MRGGWRKRDRRFSAVGKSSGGVSAGVVECAILGWW